MRLNKAVFLDKDGTLVRDIPYNVDIKKIKFYNDIAEGLMIFTKHDYKLVVVTNQPGPAFGCYTIGDIKSNRDFIKDYLKRRRINLAGYYYCPHHKKGVIKKYSSNCSCHKPNPGLIKKAGEKLKLDLSSSWMIGDILNDIEAGNKAGCRTVLVDKGNETEWEINSSRIPDAIVENFLQAALYITGKNSIT